MKGISMVLALRIKLGTGAGGGFNGEASDPLSGRCPTKVGSLLVWGAVGGYSIKVES